MQTWVRPILKAESWTIAASMDNAVDLRMRVVRSTSLNRLEQVRLLVQSAEAYLICTQE